MIFIDPIGHMVTDGEAEELHSFAKQIGLRREWYQNKRLPHYDLTTPRKIKKAMAAGAKLVTSKDIVRILTEATGPQ